MAEGLIPFIYRAIKRRRREQTFSRSLSTGSERWFGLPSRRHHHKLLRPPAIKLGSFPEGDSGQVGAAGGHHRRHRSMEDFSAAEENSTPEGRRQEREMVRFGSGRRVFACITGAN